MRQYAVNGLTVIRFDESLYPGLSSRELFDCNFDFWMHSMNDCSLSPDFTSAYCAKFDKCNPIKCLTLDSQL
jgi:hypothetical protein